MTASNFSNAFIGTMLSWLKGFANWVLRLFNLAGSSGTSPLLWLSNNWARLLVFFLVLGIAMDIIVWLVRWRPYWVWFHKERVIVNDERFFAGGRIDHRRFDEDDELRDEDWQERDFVVASAASVNPVPEAAEGDGEGEGESLGRRRSADTRVPARRARRRPTTRGTIVKRGEGRTGRRDGVVPLHGGEDEETAETDDLFGVEGGRRTGRDSYEDEVFNVSDLPEPADADDLFGGDA